MAATITDTQGIVAIAAAAVARGRADRLRGAAPCGVRRLRRAQRLVLGEPRSSGRGGPRRRHAGRVRGAARLRRGRRRRAWTGALAGAETALRGDDRAPRAGALRRLQRAVRPPVDVDRPARRRAVGDRPVVHPPSRPGARVCQAGARRARRTGALARGGRGGASRALGRRRGSERMSPDSTPPESPAGPRRASAISAPRGRSARRRCSRARRRSAVEPVAAGDDLRHRHGAAAGRGRVGDRADRELARGVRQRHARPAGGARRATWRSSARRCCGSATR